VNNICDASFFHDEREGKPKAGIELQEKAIALAIRDILIQSARDLTEPVVIKDVHLCL
jgi:hypothetical protein